MNSRIYLCIPHYGPFRNYFQYYLNSLAKNTDTLTVLLITDNAMEQYVLPENCKLVPMSLNEIRERLQRFLVDEYGVHADSNILIKMPYKLSDLRPAYSTLFADLLAKEGACEDDYVGFGDTDLIYGKIANFIDFSKKFLGFGLNGHLMALKNTDELKKSYRAIENYAGILQSEHISHADEDGRNYTKRFVELWNKGEYLNIRSDIADILPYVFLSFYYPRPATHSSVPSRWLKTFEKLEPHDPRWRTLESMEENKHLLGDIVNDLYLVRYAENRNRFQERRIASIELKDRLILHFEDGEDVERLYAHFLRRPMYLTSNQAAENFYIKNNSFYNL